MAERYAFHTISFVENLNLKVLDAAYPEARRTAHELWYPTPSGGTVFIYPFGAMTFFNVPEPERESHVARLHAAAPGGLRNSGAVDDLVVVEEAVEHPDVVDGDLVLDRLSVEGASVVAMTLAQSAAMEYYERIVDQMFLRTDQLVERLEVSGRAPLATRPLHRFIATAVGTRNEVLSILHLLDKPDAVWEDAAADRIYQQLRAEFDLADRYTALEHKLRSVQESLELVLDITRDYRLVMLEVFIVLLIAAEIVLSVWH